MKKLERQEMKRLKGGIFETVCVSCYDTPGYWNVHVNVMCMCVPSGLTCNEQYGSFNGVSCGNANTMEVSFSPCPVV